MILLSSDSENSPSTGLADIIIDTTRYRLPDVRLNRIREVSLTGIGKLECLSDVPSLMRPHTCAPGPKARKRMHGTNLIVSEETDYATHLKTEGHIIEKVDDIRPLKLADDDKLKLVSLGKEFLSLQYE